MNVHPVMKYPATITDNDDPPTGILKSLLFQAINTCLKELSTIHHYQLHRMLALALVRGMVDKRTSIMSSWVLAGQAC